MKAKYKPIFIPYFRIKRVDPSYIFYKFFQIGVMPVTFEKRLKEVEGFCDISHYSVFGL